MCICTCPTHMKNMAATIRIGVILLSLAGCCHLRQLCSSYFTFSFSKQSSKDSDAIAEFKADSELACALRCNTKGSCDEAAFHRESKKCFLYQKKDQVSIEPYFGNDNTRSRIVTMRKVAISSNDKNNIDCTSTSDKSKDSMDAVKGQHITAGSSCSAILEQNSSSPTGFYNVTIGNVTWKTRCRMNGIPGCGDGAWTLVMTINGSKNTFSYNSPQWTTKVSYQTVGQWQENKLPGYWLSNFTKICVTMLFPTITSSILVNHPAQSLYSALRDGAKKTWTADLSVMKVPPRIDKNCLLQGFNMLGPQPAMIKSRIGVESQPLKCVLPYLVRGVGIGLLSNPDMSCGEIILRHPYPRVKVCPAFCRIFIQ